MDPATIIGLLLAFGAMFTMLFMEGANVSSILLPAPMIIVFLGTIAVGIASGTISDTHHRLQDRFPRPSAARSPRSAG